MIVLVEVFEDLSTVYLVCGSDQSIITCKLIMNKELEHLWGEVSLTKEEQTEVVVDHKWLEELREVGKNCLVGKLALNKRVNMEVMKTYGNSPLECLLGRWGPGNFKGNEKPNEVNLQWCPFWVQIHGLLLGLMSGKIGTILGESIGDVEEINADEEQMAWGRYLRVRVAINISKPLKRGSTIAVEGKGNTLAIFKYEKLPDFCYVCGCLDYQELKCDEVITVKKQEGSKERIRSMDEH
ncbi:hypothetical protein CRYUN_Cryun18bG0052800 [Craigia yunnanensis]